MLIYVHLDQKRYVVHEKNVQSVVNIGTITSDSALARAYNFIYYFVAMWARLCL